LSMNNPHLPGAENAGAFRLEMGLVPLFVDKNCSGGAPRPRGNGLKLTD
jgi:hypothetical protein